MERMFSLFLHSLSIAPCAACWPVSPTCGFPSHDCPHFGLILETACQYSAPPKHLTETQCLSYHFPFGLSLSSCEKEILSGTTNSRFRFTVTLIGQPSTPKEAQTI